MGIPLRALLVEDSANDTTLLIHHLRKGGYDPVFERVETRQGMLDALSSHEWDIVISDYRMPTFSGPSALALLQGVGLDLPFIIVSGTVGEMSAVEAMKAGAHDYLMKDNLMRLVPAIARELDEARIRRERKHAEFALRESEQRFRAMADSAPMLLWMSDTQGDFTYVNKPWLDFTGRLFEMVTGLGWQAEVHEEDLAAYVDCYRIAFAARTSFQCEYRIRRHDGEWRWVFNTGAPRFHSDGVFAGYIGTCVDLTERKVAEMERENMRLENERLMQERGAAAIQQRNFLKEILFSVTEGKLTLCDTKEELPPLLDPNVESIPISDNTLRQVRKIAEKMAIVNGFSNDRCNDLVTAIGEASMNAVVHAGGGTGQVSYGNGKVQVVIKDQGRGIDITHLPRATLERGYTTAGSLGHGFYMMLACADRVYLLTGPAGTTIVLEQYQTAPEPVWMEMNSRSALLPDAELSGSF